MHDKQIRRRRAVLVLLVAISLILLTDYFGESSTSPLHSVQQGVVEVFSPIQDGASKIFSPVRDVTGWISSTIHAKSQVKQLSAQNATLHHQIAVGQYDTTQWAQDQKLLHLDHNSHLSQYGLVSAAVTGKDPSLWYDTIDVDKGTDVGVKINDPVVGAGGLVGEVSAVGTGYSEIRLLTAPQFSVGAMVEDTNGAFGVLGPAVGNPSTLLLRYIQPDNAQISYNDEVVTSGFKDLSQPNIQSFFPPDIPIGTVSNEDTQDTVLNNQQVQVHPSADLQHLTNVQILTRPHAGS